MKARPKVYVTRQLPQKGIDTLLRDFDVAMWDSTEAVPRGELLSNVRDVDALLCMCSDKIDLRVLNTAGPSLKVVGTLSEETDHIDVQECRRRGIQVIKLPSVSMDTVVNLVIATLIQALNKCSPESRLLSSTVQHNDTDNENNSEKCILGGKTLGVVGMGKVGRAVSSRLHDMGVSKVLYNDIDIVDVATEFNAEHTSFEKLLKESDIICLCCKTTSKSGQEFNKSTFKQMKNSAILIDATKGHVINNVDLYDSLRDEEIYAAGLAIREQGCIQYKDPLLALSNCYVFPFREVNQKWDLRSKHSAMVAKDLVQAVKQGYENKNNYRS